MTELDFDELDKAVNNLMSNVDTTKRPEGLDDPEDKVVSLDATTPATVTASGPLPAPAPVAQSSQPTTPSALAVKRRGQFMDVIHPSSDMTTVARPVKRDGVAVAPSTEAIAPEEPVASPPSAAPLDVNTLDMESTGTATPVVTEPVAAELSSEPEQAQSPASAWPDPIDLANQQQEEAQPAEETNPVTAPEEVPSVSDSDTQLPKEVVDEVAAPEEVAPLTTPFLPDAKVEKRPLGANSDTEATMGDAPEASDADTSAQSVAENPIVLPAELQGDVVAAESTDLTPKNDVTNLESTPAPETTSAEGATPASVSAGGSIAQQYTEQASTGDQTNGSIYDTSTYHQPIEAAVPAKKSSPLRWIIWVVVLLLIGAAAGAAYFYFTR